MNKNRKYVLLAAAGIILFSWFIFGWDGLPRRQEEHIRQISYLYRSSSVEETQQAAKQGIDQAAKDYKCEITATAFDPAITAEEQKRLIEKEVENGAEAILIEPLDDKKVAQELKKDGKKVPVIQINSWVQDESAKELKKVHVDYYRMGEELARKVLADVGGKGRILLIRPDINYADVTEACQGVKEYLESRNAILEECPMIADEQKWAGAVPEALYRRDVSAVIAFGTTQLEMCGKIKKEGLALGDTGIYGIGKSNQIISYLEEGKINAIGISNEYSVGYLSMVKALGIDLSDNGGEREIDFSIIDGKSIYTTENQRLLFPFVQ